MSDMPKKPKNIDTSGASVDSVDTSGLLHDSVHKDTGIARAAKAVRVPSDTFTEEQIGAVCNELDEAVGIARDISYVAARLILQARAERDAAEMRAARAEANERNACDDGYWRGVADEGDTVKRFVAERDAALARVRLYRQMAPQAIINKVEPERAKPLPPTKPNMKVSGYAERIATLDAENAELRERAEKLATDNWTLTKAVCDTRIAENERLRVAFERLESSPCEDSNPTLYDLRVALEGKNNE